MKKKILICSITCVMAMLSTTSSFGQTSKTEQAKSDSIADYKKFKKDAEMKIENNKQKIAELKAKKSSENKEVKEKYDKRVATLEEKNNELKQKVNSYNETSNSAKWASFKREFNHDMDELGKAMKDIGKDNTK